MEIKVLLIDKILPKVLVNRGSSLNIMLLQNMEKLGLNIIESSLFMINMANQSPKEPLGLI